MTPMTKALPATVPLLLGALAVATTQTIVVAALSPLGEDAGVGASAATWLLTAFMLASAVVTPVSGRLADVLGYRKVAAVSFVLLCIGSVVAALSTHTGWFPGLVVGRVVQGCSGGAFPALFGLARGSLPPEKLSGVVAGISAMFGVGGALGMVVAGPLVDLAGTPALFWFSLLLGVLSLVGLTALSDGEPASRTSGAASSPDIAGVTLLAAALVTLLLGVSQGSIWGWTSPATLGCLIGCVVLFALLAVVERRSAAPLVDPSLVVIRSLVWTNLATLVISVGMFAAVTLLPRFVQAPVSSGYGFGYSASRTGPLLVPMAVMMVAAAPVATALSRRFSAAVALRYGALLAAAALALFAFAHEDVWTLYLGAAVLGLAYGLAFATLGGLVVGAVEQRQTGAATGINTILRTIGGALGAQVAAVILENSASSGSPLPTEGGFTTAFLASAVVALVALVVAIGIRGHRRESGTIRA
ncbi:MAG: MFS transporter [Corynebacterium variabile]